MRKTQKHVLSVFVVLILLILLLVYFPIGGNIWNVITSRGYVIPKGSSIFTFKPTLMNAGSGEWWVYGEDKKYYYYQDGSKFLKIKAINCIDFNALTIETWCK